MFVDQQFPEPAPTALFGTNEFSSNGDHQKVRTRPCPVRCGVRRALEKEHREPA